jgi:hypothetical protein
MNESDTKPEPNSLGRPSAAEIKAAYLAVGDTASGRTVAAALVEQGYEVSARTVARCAAVHYRPFRWEANLDPGKVKKVASKKVAAVAKVKDAAIKQAPPEQVAAAVVEAIGDMSPKDGDRLKSILGQDEATIRDNMRKLHLAAGCLLAEDLATHTKLMMMAPEKAAKLYEALGASITPPEIPVAPPCDGSDARLVEGRELEEVISPSALAIREFRRKQGMAA